LLSE
jgi:pre-mRNA-processing factor 8